MIEVLVSIVILSIGLLGVAGLQVMGMKNNHSAYLRTQATTLAYQFADILRSNLTEVTAQKLGGAGTTYTGTDINTDFSTTATCYTTVGCNSSQMMEEDLLSWINNIQTTLPGGTVIITNPSSFNDTNNNYLVFGITITWVDDKEDADGDGNTTKSFTTSFRP